MSKMKCYTSGLLLANEGSFEKAIECFRMAIFLDPNFALAYTALGLAKFELKDYDGAFFDLGKAGDLGDKEAYVLRTRHVLPKMYYKFREN